ncbi:RDD family protein [Streptomyces sp. NPDC059568]|uniref:RDD family protein n=1 Tax=Streptomyces sp. NPDC059568 TaxID=3346868 RepID=UPI0036B2FB44
MATPPGDGGNVPREGFYPDPSIPGYVRYWNGAAWVPGTSRPAPQGDGTTPGTPAAPAAPGASAAPFVDETGPVFLDEEPPGGPRPEPASVWQADASRQTGFGGERDERVSWGAGGQDPRIPGPASPPSPGPGRLPALPAGSGSSAPHHEVPPPVPGDPTGGALPGVRALGPGTDDDAPSSEGAVALRAMRRGVRPGAGPGAEPNRPDADQDSGADTGGPSGSRDTGQPPVDSTVALRALRAARRAKSDEADSAGGAAGRTGQAEGTMAIRALNQGASSTGTALPARRQPQSQPSSQPQPQLPSQPTPGQIGTPQGPAAPAATPVSSGAGGGAASWAQQVHQLAQPMTPGGPDQPVVPWKPPVDDPFLQAARAQAAARPAGLAKRFVARLIDSVVLGALVGAAALPLFSRARTHIDAKIEAAERSGETVTVWLIDATTAGYLGAALVALLVLGVLYEALPTAKWGRTLGKKLCGLEVRDIESHEAPGFGAALRRWLVYGVLGMLVVGVVNVLWCLVDRPWRQCWHDKAARTFVAG